MFEPERKSCDVRGSTLFSQDDLKRNHVIGENEASTSSVVIDFKGEVGDYSVAEI